MQKIKTRFDAEKLKSLANSEGFQHPEFGNLLKSDSVIMPGNEETGSIYSEYSPYFIRISVTNRCNANCKCCVNSEITDKDFRVNTFQEINSERDAAAINKIISGINGDIIICFYGGEPLLKPEKIQQIIKLIREKSADKNVKYMLYTNGLLPGSFIAEFKDVIGQLWLVSVSIDGTKKQHEKSVPELTWIQSSRT